VSLSEQPHAVAAEASCLEAINAIRVNGGLSELVPVTIALDAQWVVSHGLLYEFVLDIAVEGSGVQTEIHFNCQALHDPTNTSVIQDFVVEGIPEPDSIMPEAWLTQAREAQESFVADHADVSALHATELPGDAVLQERSSKSPKIVEMVQRKLGHKSWDAGMLETLVDLSGVRLPWAYNAHTAYPNCVSQVQDQGACGCCYAFATATSLSERQCIYMTVEAVAAGLDPPPGVDELAQQPLIGCGSQLSIQGGSSCERNFTSGCHGGNGGMAMQYIATYGLDRSDSYPYVSGGGSATDHFDVIGEFVPQCDTGVAISEKEDNVFIYSLSKSTDERQIMAAIKAEGAVYIGFDVYEDIWEHDPHTIYDPDTTLPLQGGHSVVAYGWGAERGVGYWHCRNSWGTVWGESGDFRLGRGTGLINEAYWGSVNPLTPDPTDTSGSMPNCLIASGAWYASVDPGIFEFQGSCYFTGTNNCNREIKLWGSNWGLSCYQQYALPPGETRLFNAPCDLNLRVSMSPLMPAFTGPPMQFAAPSIAGTDTAFTGPTNQPTFEPTLDPTTPPVPSPTDQPTAQPTLYPSSSPTYMSACSVAYIGDGYCDPGNNNLRCGYDGGDCCGSTCTSAVYTCGDDGMGFAQCIDPSAPAYETVGGREAVDDGQPSMSPTRKPTAARCKNWWVGDGHCDPVNNVVQCNFDGGDCCESTCTDQQWRARRSRRNRGTG
jgi:C1A family cysteine protease